MDVSEEGRRVLYDGLVETIGAEGAGVLMELLPRSPSGELVTRTDMHANTIMLRGEMAELRGELAELRAELRGELAELRGHVDTQFAVFLTKQAELVDQMASLRADLAKWLITALLSNVAIMVALVLLVSRLSG